jgi:ABC-type glycerol-3-phosphate transport system permease component
VRKLLQLIFGDARNVISVAVAVLAAYGLSRVAPGAAGALLALLLIAAAAAQAL